MARRVRGVRGSDLNDLHAELIEIDENLMRNNFGPAEEAGAVARRKAIYEELHPETKHGANQHTRGVDNLSTPSDRFTAATSEATGKDERTIAAPPPAAKRSAPISTR